MRSLCKRCMLIIWNYFQVIIMNKNECEMMYFELPLSHRYYINSILLRGVSIPLEFIFKFILLIQNSSMLFRKRYNDIVNMFGFLLGIKCNATFLNYIETSLCLHVSIFLVLPHNLYLPRICRIAKKINRLISNCEFWRYIEITLD